MSREETQSTPDEGAALPVLMPGRAALSEDLEETDESVSEPLSGVGLASALYGRIHVQDNLTRLIRALSLAHFRRDMDETEHVE